MKVPYKVLIGGYPVTIKYVDELVDGDGGSLAGETVALSHTVKISTTSYSNSTPDRVKSTILHELMHVAMAICGHSELLGEKKEEAVVYGLEAMLAPLLTFDAKNKSIRWKEVDFPWE